MPYSSVATTVVTVQHPRIPQTVEWDKFDGGDLTHSNQTFYTAPRKERKFRGKSTRDNVTLEAHLDPVAHAEFIKAGNAGDVFEDAVIRVVSVDANGAKLGEDDVYSGCMVAKWTPRKVDLNADDMQKIVVEWEVPAP